MIVNGLVSDGQSIEMVLSLQEFKDLYLLFDSITNEGANDKFVAEVMYRVKEAIDHEGMVYHSEYEIFNLYHAASILMRPLADNITSHNKARQNKTTKEASDKSVQ